MIMNNIAIIPARGGSKRIPRKNIRPFLGRPIISYSIEAALEAQCFDEIMVSTDDPEIAEIARKFGAIVPFMRSPENASDIAGTAEALIEVYNTYLTLGKQFSHLCCIYPTAPFITPTKLRNGMEILHSSGADCVLPIVSYSYPIQRALKLESGQVVMIWPDNYPKRSQDLAPSYHDCGQFYCMSAKSLLQQKKLFADHTVPMLMPETEVQDIDTLQDWELAEIKYLRLQPLV